MLSYLQAIDSSFLEYIRTIFMVPQGFEGFITIIADSEPVLFGLFLIGLWIYGISEKSNDPKYVALDLFWHVMGAFAIYWVINQLLPVRPRPEMVSSIPPLIDHLPDNSFPSGHAMFWGASWWALHVLLKKRNVTWAFFILGAITCFMRVIAGIHYPGDIIVGFFLGWLFVHILTRLPHGEKYRKYAHDIPAKIAYFFKL